MALKHTRANGDTRERAGSAGVVAKKLKAKRAPRDGGLFVRGGAGRAGNRQNAGGARIPGKKMCEKRISDEGKGPARAARAARGGRRPRRQLCGVLCRDAFYVNMLNADVTFSDIGIRAVVEPRAI
ncbi:hypothetical protein EVAR_32196_1 [Eumeta japonica]|uniref:Uncharacterized protein n=1 Tax=Eumeta variegata TaxID=151549 RepID=A0A4C1VYE9_EUMVA|nr:hypothetical protein EVAR_32196_1 [Eumeta japonica]